MIPQRFRKPYIFRLDPTIWIVGYVNSDGRYRAETFDSWDGAIESVQLRAGRQQVLDAIQDRVSGQLERGEIVLETRSGAESGLV